MSRRIAAVVGVCLVGCAPKSPETQAPASRSSAAAAWAGDGALFLQGFDVRWHARPHRLSALGFGARGTPDAGADLTGELWARVRGGTWASGEAASDVATLSVQYGGIVSPDLSVATATVELGLNGALGKKGEAGISATTTETVRLELPEAWGGDRPVVAWISGFALDTMPSHPNGYTPRAVAVSLSEPRPEEGGQVAVDVTARLDAAPVPDRRQALAEYGGTAVVDLVVVTAPEGRASRLRAALEEDWDLLDEIALKRGPKRVAVQTELAPQTLAVVGGLSAFSLEVTATGPVAGRYMRALSVSLEDERVDAARGSYQAHAALRFANSGTIARKLHVSASSEFAVLQLFAPAQVRKGRWRPPAGQEASVDYPAMTPRLLGP